MSAAECSTRSISIVNFRGTITPSGISLLLLVPLAPFANGLDPRFLCHYNPIACTRNGLSCAIDTALLLSLFISRSRLSRHQLKRQSRLFEYPFFKCERLHSSSPSTYERYERRLLMSSSPSTRCQFSGPGERCASPLRDALSSASLRATGFTLIHSSIPRYPRSASILSFLLGFILPSLVTLSFLP